ncbi:MAG: 30S ribosomal protein S20 [Candidatus Moranbacteria bacterium]|nr:30S ribosomal protein S20 [Candidatus Moranbacteria bacterium]
MANHKSALKRIRTNRRKQLRNRYHAKTMRNAIKKFRLLNDTAEAKEQYPKIVSLIDKNAKRNIIHKNKAANLKSKLSKKLVATE